MNRMILIFTHTYWKIISVYKDISSKKKMKSFRTALSLCVWVRQENALEKRKWFLKISPIYLTVSPTILPLQPTYLSILRMQEMCSMFSSTADLRDLPADHANTFCLMNKSIFNSLNINDARLQVNIETSSDETFSAWNTIVLEGIQ